jgi:hypothetical protein
VDVQHIIDALLSLVILIFGTLMKMMHSDLKDNERRVDDLPNIYARRDDVKDLNDRIFAQLDRIELKIDRKQDKSG